MKLGGGVELSWTSDKDNVEMEVRSVLANQDWLAIGFSDYGELTNADFCVLWRDWTQKLRVSDVFTNEVMRENIWLAPISKCSMFYQVSRHFRNCCQQSFNQESRVISDKKQDCKNSKWRKRRTESGKEEMEWVFSRGLDTCDEEDYRIEEGTTHLIWAVGRGPLYNINGVNISDKELLLNCAYNIVYKLDCSVRTPL